MCRRWWVGGMGVGWRCGMGVSGPSATSSAPPSYTSRVGGLLEAANSPALVPTPGRMPAHVCPSGWGGWVFRTFFQNCCAPSQHAQPGPGITDLTALFICETHASPAESANTFALQGFRTTRNDAPTFDRTRRPARGSLWYTTDNSTVLATLRSSAATGELTTVMSAALSAHNFPQLFLRKKRSVIKGLLSPLGATPKSKRWGKGADRRRSIWRLRDFPASPCVHGASAFQASLLASPAVKLHVFLPEVPDRSCRSIEAAPWVPIDRSNT